MKTQLPRSLLVPEQRAEPGGTREDFWWLLMQVGTLSRRVAERRLASASTSPDQVQALRAIKARDRMTVGELARSMGLELSQDGRALLNASEPDTTGLADELLAGLSQSQIDDSARVLETIREAAGEVLRSVTGH